MFFACLAAVQNAFCQELSQAKQLGQEMTEANPDLPCFDAWATDGGGWGHETD